MNSFFTNISKAISATSAFPLIISHICAQSLPSHTFCSVLNKNYENTIEKESMIFLVKFKVKIVLQGNKVLRLIIPEKIDKPSNNANKYQILPHIRPVADPRQKSQEWREHKMANPPFLFIDSHKIHFISNLLLYRHN